MFQRGFLNFVFKLRSHLTDVFSIYPRFIEFPSKYSKNEMCSFLISIQLPKNCHLRGDVEMLTFNIISKCLKILQLLHFDLHDISTLSDRSRRNHGSVNCRSVRNNASGSYPYPVPSRLYELVRHQLGESK